MPDTLDDQTLALLFYPRSDVKFARRHQEPVWLEVHQELKQKGVTKTLLWKEHSRQYPNRCYSYSQYCARYDKWLHKQKPSMHQIHRAGEKLFIDYAGPTVPVICTATREIRQAIIFVAMMSAPPIVSDNCSCIALPPPASMPSYAEATWTKSLPYLLGSHIRAFEFFGSTPKMLVPDNLKSAFNKSYRYDPELNPSYQKLASHYL